MQTLTWMNKKITRIFQNFSRFFDKWKLEELSSQLIKLKEHVFLVFFPKIGGHSKRQCHYTRSYFFVKKKENSRSFLYLTNLLKLKFPGRIQRTETGAILFPLMRSRGVLWDFSPFIVRPASTMKVKCSHWLSEAILDEELLAAWRGRGVALYPNEINLNNVSFFHFGGKNQGKSGGSCLLN